MKENYIRNQILNGMDDVKKEKIMDFITKNFSCRTSRKYIVWIANECQKKSFKHDFFEHEDLEIYKKIIDWAYQNKIDLSRFDFAQANKEQDNWHKKLAKSKKTEKSNAVDESRILYKFKNGCFMYFLNSKDLKFEGSEMGHCVSGYKEKLENKECLIFSLRDKNNKPHVTIELLPNGSFSQIQGKENKPPVKKYKDLLFEFFEYFL